MKQLTPLPLSVVFMSALAACFASTPESSNQSSIVGGDSLDNQGNNPGREHAVRAVAKGVLGQDFVLQINGESDTYIDSIFRDGGMTSTFDAEAMPPTTHAFAAKVAEGATYTVTIKTQPQRPAQTCVVMDGTGTMGTSDVTVQVDCPTALP